jgi:hypothetical protein
MGGVKTGVKTCYKPSFYPSSDTTEDAETPRKYYVLSYLARPGPELLISRFGVQVPGGVLRDPLCQYE